MIRINHFLKGNLLNKDAHRKSAEIDPRIDMAYFQTNPLTRYRERPASNDERKAYGFGDSPTAITEVSLINYGGLCAIHRLTWDPAKGKRPTTTL